MYENPHIHNEQNSDPINNHAHNERTTDNTTTGGPVWEGESYHSGPLPNNGRSTDAYGSTYGRGAEPYAAPSNGDQPDGNRGTYASQPDAQQPNQGQPVWHQSTWQGAPQQPVYQPRQRRKKPKKEGGTPKKHRALRVLAGVLGCFLISACSIGVFVGLVNGGVIQFGSDGGSGNAAFTIEKLIDNSSSKTEATSNGSAKLLSKQEVVKKVVPSVVLVQMYENTRGSFLTNGQTAGGRNGQDEQNGSQNGEQNGNGQNGSADNSGVSPSGEGSGIIMSSDGYIMTNAHVVEGASALKVVLHDGKTYQAKLVGSDEVTDLALLKIEASGLTAASFGSSADLQVGDDVIAIGNPGGSELASSSTFGNVSALNRPVTDSENGYTIKCIQTDAAINPGNSGGALVNMYGQVIGINSSKLPTVGNISAEGLGFAIPIDTAQPIITELKQYGAIKSRAQLGITGAMVDSMTAQFYRLPTTGMLITKISNPELTKAGATTQDIITKIDDTAVTASGTITSVVATKKPGDTVKLELVNGVSGAKRSVSVKLIAQSTDENS